MSAEYDLGLRISRRLNVHVRSYWYRLNVHEAHIERRLNMPDGSNRTMGKMA